VTGTGRRRGEPAAEEEAYRSEEFSFVDEENAQDVIDWLAFTETRTERREERRRRSRNRMIALGVTFVLLLVAGGGYTLWRWLGDDVGSAESGERAAVLFQVRAESGAAIANAVLLRAGDRGSMMVVPASLRLQAGNAQTSVRTALAAVGPSQSRAALAELLGVRLDGSWILEQVAFISLLDRFGGVQLDVDTDVEVNGTKVLSAGPQRLTGKNALLYGTYLAAGEPPEAQAERFERVLQAMFRTMPTEQPDAVRMLENLGVISDPDLSNQRLGGALSGLAAGVDRKRVEVGNLPVREDGVVDVRGAGPVVRKLLAAAVSQTRDTGPPRIFVEDATGRGGDGDPDDGDPDDGDTGDGGETVDAQQAAGVRLLGGGYRYINGGRADEPAEKTTIEVSDTVRDAQQAGTQVALTLGVPTSAVKLVEGDQIAADIVVVVGADFRP
jgi:hypothetical protein